MQLWYCLDVRFLQETPIIFEETWEKPSLSKFIFKYAMRSNVTTPTVGESSCLETTEPSLEKLVSVLAEPVHTSLMLETKLGLANRSD